jgi:hypothetical protein
MLGVDERSGMMMVRPKISTRTMRKMGKSGERFGTAGTLPRLLRKACKGKVEIGVIRGRTVRRCPPPPCSASGLRGAASGRSAATTRLVCGEHGRGGHPGQHGHHQSVTNSASRSAHENPAHENARTSLVIGIDRGVRKCKSHSSARLATPVALVRGGWGFHYLEVRGGRTCEKAVTIWWRSPGEKSPRQVKTGAALDIA